MRRRERDRWGKYCIFSLQFQKFYFQERGMKGEGVEENRNVEESEGEDRRGLCV